MEIRCWNALERREVGGFGTLWNGTPLWNAAARRSNAAARRSKAPVTQRIFLFSPGARGLRENFKVLRKKIKVFAWHDYTHAPTPTHARKLRSHKHARRRTGFKRTGGATTQHERGFVARSTCLGLGLRERGPLGLGGREVHGRGPSRPRACFCSALGVDGVACGSVAAHPEPANATTTLNAERIDVRVSGRPRESLLVGRRRSGHRVSRRPGEGLS